MEDTDQCYDVRTSASDVSSLSDDASIVSESSSDTTDPVCMSRKRRRYRTEYLQYKRLRAAGNEDVLPPVRTFPILIPSTLTCAASSDDSVSKEMKRKMANRESARRSREAVDMAIHTAEHDMEQEERTRIELENELNLLHRLVNESQVVAEAFVVVDAADDLLFELFESGRVSEDDWSSSLSSSTGEDGAMDISLTVPLSENFDEDVMQLLATW